MDVQTPHHPPAAAGARDRAPARVRRRTLRRLAVAVAFLALGLAFVAPALPGTASVLGGENLYYFRPPLSELRPPDVTRANGLLADPVEVFHPDLEWTVEQVRSGALPLWNPEVGTGWPQLASQQTAPLFPTNLLAYALGTWDALGLSALLRILLAAAGTYLLCRSTLRLRAGPAVLGAVAFAAGSYFVSWLGHPHGNVYALLPWLLLATDGVIRRGSARDVAGLGAAIGLGCLGGHPQSLLIDAFLVAPFAAWRLAPAGRRSLGGTAPLPRAVLGLAAACGLGLAAGAVMLLPLLEFIGQSATDQRGGLGGIGGSALLTALLPELWGRPDAGFAGTGPINYFERTIYVGAPALMLAAGGHAVRRDGAPRFFAAMALAGVLMAVSLPVITTVMDEAPPFSLVAMVRALVITSFCLAILAAYGLQHLLSADAAARRRALVAAGAVAVAPLLWLLALHADAIGALGGGLGAVPVIPGEPLDADAALAGAVARWSVLAALVAALLLVLHRRPRAALGVAGALIALQTVDLVELGRGLHPVVDERVVEAGPTPALRRAMTNQGAGRTTGSGSYLLPNVGQRFDLRDSRVRGQPTIGRVDRLYAAYTGRVPRTFDVDGPRAGDVLDAFAVDQVLTGARAADPADPELRLVTASADDRLYRNTGALPRAYVATSWRRPSDEDAALAMTTFSPTDDLRTAPVVELPSGPPFVVQPPGGSARLLRDEPDRVTLAASSPAPARLVLLDAYYPGWEATVNGREAPIAPTNTAFRSVPIPAGRSTVEFRYRPRSVYAGAAISGAAWLALLAVPGAALARRRVRASAARRP